MVSQDRVSGRLNYWKTQLIDKSKRNRLLYFRPAPTSTAKLVDPPLQELFTRLVVKEQILQFYPLEPRRSLLDFDGEEEEEDLTPLVVPPLRADEVRSNHGDRRLLRTLYSLRQKSRTSLNEQGVVTLFIAFGFVEWLESQDSTIKVQSPLLLVPVDLVQESSKENYRLTLFEDEIALNPTLLHVFSTDFGITLPELPELDSLDLLAYLSDVRNVLQDRAHWTVTPDAYLGLFSFHKIRMYKDLETHADKALSHPVVRALAGDRSRMPSEPAGLPAESDLDRIVTPSETFQILDADSSQQEAIQAAKRGISLILQGPPGTGKSQTIANIIAERLAADKRVLFVSEKMAALEVVYRRLAERGIGDFCLQAHSHKANKKEVIGQLGSALNSSKRPSNQGEPDFTEYSRIRERLNDYVAALHTLRQPSSKTAHQVHGELACLASAPDLLFEFDRTGTMTPTDLTRVNEVISDLARVHDVVVAYTKHPWFGVRIAQYNPNQTKADVRAHFSALVRLLSEVENHAIQISEMCGIPPPICLMEVDRLVTLSSLVAVTPKPPASWFSPNAPTRLMEEAKKYQLRFRDYHARRNALLQSYRPEIFGLPHGELEHRLRIKHKSLLERVVLSAREASDTIISERQTLQSALSSAVDLLARIQTSSTTLAASCGLLAPSTLSQVKHIITAAILVARNPKPLQTWFTRPRLVELRAIAEEAGPYYGAYHQGRDEIRSRYQETFFSLDIPSLFTRFTGPYSNPLRLINPAYYSDLRRIRAELNSAAKLSFDDALIDLKAGRQVLQKKQWIDANSADHATAFGRHYEALGTNWVDVLVGIDTTRELLDCLGEGRVTDATRHMLIEGDVDTESLTLQIDLVRAELTSLEQHLAGIQRFVSMTALPFTNRTLREADLVEFRQWLVETNVELIDLLAAWDEVATLRQTSLASSALTVAEILCDLHEAEALVKIEADVQSHALELHAEFGHLFSGMNTRWEDILSALDWVGQVMNWFTGQPPETFVAVASGKQPRTELINAQLTLLNPLLEHTMAETSFVHEVFSEYLKIGDKSFAEAAFGSVRSWLQLRLDRLSDLDKWMDFQALKSTCAHEGLSSFLGVLCRDKPAASTFKNAFYKRYWSLWLDATYRDDSALAGFDGRRHDEHIARFRKLDLGQLSIAQKRLRSRLERDRPRTGTGAAPTGEMSILLRENAKKTRHKPLRRLFRDMPNLLVALKPCLLMSPLSVATFLDPTVIEFDTIIFDEASQICSEDAVGAIMRGKQLIVVGDSQQLPPTRFFSAGTAEEYDTEDDEDDGSNDVYESILDECSTIGLSPWMLRWHYRSRCEALIAFSNYHMYKNRLVTFPGPHLMDSESADRCVQFVHVPDGVYVRGKGQEAGTNRNEARKVADLVFEHFRTRPERSLGVIAFSERQQTAIDDEIRRRRDTLPEYERFFSEHVDSNEPFFIKNLENVQGDERDSIIFSMGYGRDQNGKLLMNFGPLNKEGGERRLNVAVTRAKYQVKLVSSIQPNDMDLSKTEKKGPALLKYYMQFAQLGPSSLAREQDVPDDPEFDSPFEEEVCRSLEDRGLIVRRQIGCAGYKIDLAIVDPKHPGQFRLGIECDGATYHSSKTARDRDRLRQQVLEEMGWQNRIIRIWSSDWVQNRSGQIDRVMLAYSGDVRDSDNESSIPVTPDVDPVYDDVGGSDVEENEWPEEQQPPISTEPPPAQNASSVPDGTVPYRAYEGSRLGEPAHFYAIADANPGFITDLLGRVVSVEGPIHVVEATRRVVAHWGMGKAGAVLRQTIRIAATRAAQRGTITIRGDFLWPADMVEVVVRVPALLGDIRNIQYVPIEEIVAACILCVRGAFAIQQDELITQVARLFGNNRTGTNVRERIQDGINLAVRGTRLEIKEGAVRLVKT